MDADGRLKAGRLGWEAAGPLEAGTKGLAPKLEGCAGAAPTDPKAAELGGMLKSPPEGGARLALVEPSELLAFIQLPAPAFAVGCRFPKRDRDGGAEAAPVEAGCVGKLLTIGAKLGGAAAAPEAPAAGRAMQGFSRLQQGLPGHERKQHCMSCSCGYMESDSHTVSTLLTHTLSAQIQWMVSVLCLLTRRCTKGWEGKLASSSWLAIPDLTSVHGNLAIVCLLPICAGLGCALLQSTDRTIALCRLYEEALGMADVVLYTIQPYIFYVIHELVLNPPA